MTSEECQEVAKDLFADLVLATSGPRDAGEVVFYLHLMVWKAQEEPRSAERMLDALKTLFLKTLGEGLTVQ